MLWMSILCIICWVALFVRMCSILHHASDMDATDGPADLTQVLNGLGAEQREKLRQALATTTDADTQYGNLAASGTCRYEAGRTQFVPTGIGAQFCAACGTRLGLDARFCRQCGRGTAKPPSVNMSAHAMSSDTQGTSAGP